MVDGINRGSTLFLWHAKHPHDRTDRANESDPFLVGHRFEALIKQVAHRGGAGGAVRYA